MSKDGSERTSIVLLCGAGVVEKQRRGLGARAKEVEVVVEEVVVAAVAAERRGRGSTGQARSRSGR